jgi:hypothetical protein
MERGEGEEDEEEGFLLYTFLTENTFVSLVVRTCILL